VITAEGGLLNLLCSPGLVITTGGVVGFVVGFVVGCVVGCVVGSSLSSSSVDMK